MLQHCILTSLFFRLGPTGEIFLVGREIGYLWFVGCKVLPKFGFCNLIKIGPNSIYKRQRRHESSFSPELLCSEWRLSICRDTQKCNFAIYNLHGNFQAHKTLMPFNKVKKSSHFVHWPFRSSGQRMGRRSENNKAHKTQWPSAQRYLFVG